MPELSSTTLQKRLSADSLSLIAIIAADLMSQDLLFPQYEEDEIETDVDEVSDEDETLEEQQERNQRTVEYFMQRMREEDVSP